MLIFPCCGSDDDDLLKELLLNPLVVESSLLSFSVDSKEVDDFIVLFSECSTVFRID